MNPSKSLTPKEKKLINGGWPPKLWSNCVSSSGARVNSEEGKNVQRLGVKLGCHSCGSSYPASVYIADHIFPAEFCTSYMEKVFALLDLDYESYFELRPQCPKCSCCQGGNVAHIAKLAREFAAENDIVVYK